MSQHICNVSGIIFDTKDGWIDCAKEMPDILDRTLVCHDGMVEIAVYIGNNLWGLASKRFKSRSITRDIQYWMPLPKVKHD